MLQDGTLYDKSLDVAYAKNIGAIKLDAAHKIIGSRASDAPQHGRRGKNKAAHIAGSQDSIHEDSNSAINQADSVKQPENGINSPTETITPKKRGRPKKTENKDTQIIQDQDNIHEEPKSATNQADSGKQLKNGINSPTEISSPKKRGRPKKPVTSG